MRSKLRSKAHKEVVKYMRKVNKQIMNDEYLGLNRFRLDMLREDWHEYEDKSGGMLGVLFKIKDNLTGNKAAFYISRFNFEWHISEYVNDFLIRCSNGHRGSIPSLSYCAYDVHDIVPYGNHKVTDPSKYEDGVVCKYDWINLGW